MPYHVRISIKSSKRMHDDIVRLDLTEKELRERFLTPYKTGSPIVTQGRTIKCDEIKSIRISYTEESSKVMSAIVREEHRSKRIAVLGGPHPVFMRGIDLTDTFITTPPGQEKVEPNTRQWEKSQQVYVVHGRDLKIKESIEDFLKMIGLHPIDWLELIKETGEPSPYLGNVLDKTFEIAQAIIVLLTPDDEARLRKKFIKDNDPQYEKELTHQARPNVLFEAGMAIAKRPDHTILIEIGNIRPFSDIIGRHVVKLDNSLAKKKELISKLDIAGCKLNPPNNDECLEVYKFHLE